MKIRPRCSTDHRRPGFTLVELLVVIAMIVILIGLVLFATTALQQTSKGLTCLSKQRQMMLAWDGYASDNAGRYVAPDTNRHSWDWVRSVGNNMGPGNTEREEALTEGRLFPYVGDVRLYKSPFDRSDYVRTYSLSAFFTDGEGTSDWGGPPSWSIGTRSRIPRPSDTISMVAEHDRRGHNINGWGINPFTPDWIDQLMIWDEGHFNFAFADGHVERRKWAGTSYTNPEPIEVAFNSSTQLTNVYYPGPDWDWVSERLFPGSAALYGGW
ncbi:MAG: type II secretion system protein [Phycisphaerales bacterium]|nr:type II secretion system protein [Phycisphaerales bacterium]MDG2133040.1 type II secretion system protein [Phycisphaerales bacterium]